MDYKVEITFHYANGNDDDVTIKEIGKCYKEWYYDIISNPLFESFKLVQEECTLTIKKL